MLIVNGTYVKLTDVGAAYKKGLQQEDNEQTKEAPEDNTEQAKDPPEEDTGQQDEQNADNASEDKGRS